MKALNAKGGASFSRAEIDKRLWSGAAAAGQIALGEAGQRECGHRLERSMS